MTGGILARLARTHQLAALRHRGFRLLWTATLLSATARWADMVVIGWLTLELTNSALMVGIVAGAKMAGYFAAPFMGVIADRMDKRLLLITASATNLAVAAIMLLLFVTGVLALWHVIALAVVSSLTWAMDNPARQSLVPELVHRDALTNAIALNAVAIEITVVVGPALGGLLIPALGMEGAYAFIVGVYCCDLTTLLILKSAKHVGTTHRESPLKSLVGGFRYVRANRLVLVLLLIAFALNLLAAPYRYAFMPVFSRYVLDAGPTGYGMLTAMAGLGALVAGVWVVSLGNFHRKGRLLVWMSFAWPATLLLFAASTWYSVSLALVFAAGLTQAFVWTIIATLILNNTAADMRGRVMGLRTGVVGSLPIGNLLAGAVAERYGAQLAQGAYAVVAIGVMIAIVVMAPNLYRAD